ncbi:MAG: amphi-Trp domain-containing protein [Candidatus Coatesbacteria bacterium]|nr:amphi-Trp domain-containing protein [Candidatus Coatesbacteria bacterium]
MSDKVASKGLFKRDEVVHWLEELVAGLKKGELNIAAGADNLILLPGETFEVALKAKEKDDEEKLSLKLNWRSSAGFHIGSATAVPRPGAKAALNEAAAKPKPRKKPVPTAKKAGKKTTTKSTTTSTTGKKKKTAQSGKKADKTTSNRTKGGKAKGK